MSKKKISSCELGINLKSKKEEELFKWFLASILFGKPIQQEIAKRTYFEFITVHIFLEDVKLIFNQLRGGDKYARVN